MFDSLECGAHGLSTDDILKAAEATERAKIAAENEQLVWAVAWADAYPAESIHPDQLALNGGPSGVRPGGDGTPEVNDLAMIEFGAKIGKGVMATFALIGDALDLRHRLPLLWHKLMACELAGWQGCKIARLTRELTVEQAGEVDAQIIKYAGTVGWTKLQTRTLAAIRAIGPDHYERLVAGRRKERGVWLTQADDDGVKGIYGRLDAPDAIELYATIEELAGFLPKEHGSADERRAEAMGLLGHGLEGTRLRARHRQPDLFTDDLAAAVQPVAGEDPGDPVEESEIHPALRDQPVQPSFDEAVFEEAVKRLLEGLDPDKLRPTCELVVHIAAESLETGHGICRVPGIGPTTMGVLKQWLGHRRVRVRPVIDLNDIPPPVDAYEIPDRLRQHILLRQPASTFPWSTAIGRLDLDHLCGYVSMIKGGPPGQTRIEDLTPLARPEHRAVTHGGWKRRQPELGTMLYRAPHGTIYVTNATGTHDLGNGTFANTIWNTGSAAQAG